MEDKKDEDTPHPFFCIKKDKKTQPGGVGG